MVTQVTDGIKITIKTRYQDHYSHPEHNNFVFSYDVSIENTNDSPVRLLKRHWFIFDSSGEYREVSGDGVIGQQPEISSGEVYAYESACHLETDLGKMDGYYLMEHVHTGEMFKVRIPEFELMTPFKMN